jgi:hypothetical protein
MGRRSVRRLAIASLCFGLAACVVNLSFDLNQPGLVLMTSGSGAYSTSILVDLGNSPDVRAHQKDIRSLDLEYVDLTITGKGPNNAATVLSATLWLQRQPGDPMVKIGELTNFQAVVNTNRRLNGNPELDAFLLERLHDGGKFYFVATGNTDNRTDLVMDVNLHASMGYETGLF